MIQDRSTIHVPIGVCPFHPATNLFGMVFFFFFKYTIEFISTYNRTFYDDCSLLLSQDSRFQLTQSVKFFMIG